MCVQKRWSPVMIVASGFAWCPPKVIQYAAATGGHSLSFYFLLYIFIFLSILFSIHLFPFSLSFYLSAKSYPPPPRSDLPAHRCKYRHYLIAWGAHSIALTNQLFLFKLSTIFLKIMFWSNLRISLVPWSGLTLMKKKVLTAYLTLITENLCC